MKLKDIYKGLLKEDRTKEIGRQKAEDLLSKVKYEFSGKIPKIYRGKKESIDFGWIEPSNYTRVSANTQNYYTLIIDNSSRWDNFPKRSKSIVCSTSEKRASSYTGLDGGAVYRVFPRVGAKIGVCPEPDIFESFSKIQEMFDLKFMGKFNNFLDTLYGWSMGNMQKNLSESWPQLKNELNKIASSKRFIRVYEGDYDFDRHYPKPPSKTQFRIKKAAENFFPNYSSFYNFIEDLMDPKENGFYVEEFSGGLSLPENREVWTSADSLLINVRSFDWKDSEIID